MDAGATFLLPGLDDHLWLVISDPFLDANRIVVVCFLSWKEHLDQACIVKPGEHPFVKHDTCVQYATARVVTAERLKVLQDGGQLRMKAPLSPSLLDRIRKGAENGDIPTECYEVLRSQGFVG